jgi:hypothetical protein
VHLYLRSLVRLLGVMLKQKDSVARFEVLTVRECEDFCLHGYNVV